MPQDKLTHILGTPFSFWGILISMGIKIKASFDLAKIYEYLKYRYVRIFNFFFNIYIA